MTNLPTHIDDACDEIDAAIFTGDLFYTDPTALAELEVYINRWKRGLDSIKQFIEDDE